MTCIDPLIHVRKTYCNQFLLYKKVDKRDEEIKTYCFDISNCLLDHASYLTIGFLGASR